MPETQTEFRIPSAAECDALLTELDKTRRVLRFIKSQHRAAAAGEEPEEDEPEPPKAA